jgi:hypothetical protein
MRYLKIIIPALIFMFSCEKTGNVKTFDNMEVTSQLSLDNSIIISNGDCAGNFQTHTYLCLDSILSDSRCPTGAMCFWAGEAVARLKFSASGEKPVFFTLKPAGDTVINGYKFTLKSLLPYPTLEHHPEQDEYKVEMLVESI